MKKVIGIVGETGSGKDLFANHVKEINPNVISLGFSSFLTEALKIFVDDIKKEDQQWIFIILKNRFGEDILANAVRKRVKEIEDGVIILSGIRRQADFDLIRELEGEVVYVTAESKLRWQRIQNRGEKVDDKCSYEKFLELEQVETELLIPKMGEQADYRIENNGSLEEFYNKIDFIINDIIGK